MPAVWISGLIFIDGDIHTSIDFLKAPLHILTVLYGGVAVLLAVVGVVSVVGNKEKRQNVISVQKGKIRLRFTLRWRFFLLYARL